jgi:hypothetical protein
MLRNDATTIFFQKLKNKNHETFFFIFTQH